MKILRKSVTIIVLIASCFWLAKSFIQYGDQLTNWRPNSYTFLFLFMESLIYGCNCFLLSSAWIKLLTVNHHFHYNKLQCHIIYSRSQIAKYLPGNVFHFAGRYVLGREIGIGKGVLVSSAFYENLGILVAAILICLPAFIFNRYIISIINLSEILLYSGVGVIVCVAALILSNQFTASSMMNFSIKQVYSLLAALTRYLFFFLIFGLIALMTIWQIDSVELFNVALVISAFSIAWVAGFVTPGAPAGIGIREFTVTLLLTPLLGEANSFLTAILFRLVTVFGDFLFFLSSFILSFWLSHNRSSSTI